MNLNLKRDLYKYLEVEKDMMVCLFFNNIKNSIKNNTDNVDEYNIEFKNLHKKGNDILDKLVILRNQVFHSDFILIRENISILKTISKWQTSSTHFFAFSNNSKESVNNKLMDNIEKEIKNKFSAGKSKIIIEKLYKL